VPEILNCFPLTVFKDGLGLERAYRHKLGDFIIQSYRDGVKTGQSNQAAWTGDKNGWEFLHEETVFAAFFKAVHNSLRAYLDMLSVNGERVALHYTRSWGTVSERGQSIRRHRHNQSHISVVYYPVKDANTGNLIFHMPDPLNELSPGLFEPHAVNQGLLKASTPLNSEMVDLPVAEDDIVIFPSKTYHGTEPNNTDGRRISIAIDVVMTLSDSTGVEYLLPPVGRWREAGGD
jgi:uncharacterized protein (TIGR02466 family)